MGIIKNDNYFTVKGWMINELRLSGSSLIAYAVIYGFSQDGKSSFRGSMSYLASCAGVSTRGIRNILQGLVDKGYITKSEAEDDGRCNIYMAVDLKDAVKEMKKIGEKSSPILGEDTGKIGEKSSEIGEVFSEIGEKTSPNINIILDLEESHTDRAGVKSTAQTNKEHFIKLWQENSDVFNPLSRLYYPKDFDGWWEKSPVTTEMIDRAVKHVADAVKSGAIERRFVPGSPDKFVLNGWIHRSQEPYALKSGPPPPGERQFGRESKGTVDLAALCRRFNITGTEPEKRRRLLELREQRADSY
jgi:hypothetical protein